MLAPATTAKSRRTPTATITDPKILIPAIGESFKKLNPVTLAKNPVMFVVEVVALLVTVLFVRDVIIGRPELRLLDPDHPLAVVHGSVREFRGSRRRRAAAKPRPPAFAQQKRTSSPRNWRTPKTTSATSLVPAMQLKPGDVVFVEAGDLIPVRRRRDRRRRLRERSGHYRRVRSGDPRVGRRPLGGDGRHACHFGLDRGPHHGRPGLNLPRPNDRACRRRGTEEDAERDRAEHPACGHDDHLRLCRREHSELRSLCRRQHLGPRAGRSLRDADPDDHRRAACPPSASRAWTGSCASMCSPCQGAPWRPRATWIRCCSTRPAPSRSATGRRRSSFLCRTSPRKSLRMPRSLPRCRTRRRKGAPSWFWPRSATASGAATWPTFSAHHFIPFSAQTRISGIDLEGEQIRKGAVDAVVNYVRQATGNPNMPAAARA